MLLKEEEMHATFLKMCCSHQMQNKHFSKNNNSISRMNMLSLHHFSSIIDFTDLFKANHCIILHFIKCSNLNLELFYKVVFWCNVLVHINLFVNCETMQAADE